VRGSDEGSNKKINAEVLGILKVNSCDDAMDTVQRLATPWEGVSFKETHTEVLLDSRYNEGLRLAALKIAKKTKKPIKNDENLFDDFKASFIEAGAKEIDAEEMTWNTLGVMSASGTRQWLRFVSIPYGYDQGQKRLALQTIANCLPIIDHNSAKTGHIYSFPKEIQGGCNTGKNYHFWSSAFMSRKAALESGNPEAAVVAAYQAEKFYNMNKAKTGGFTMAGHMVQGEMFSPASNVIRIDLAQSAAGAMWGAQKATTREPSHANIDSTVKKLIEKAGRGSVSPAVQYSAGFLPEPIASYPAWMSKFNPNILMDNVDEIMKPTGRVRKEFLEFSKTPQTLKCERQQPDTCTHKE